VVDDYGRTAVMDELVMLRAGRGHDPGPQDPGDLHGEVPEPARSCRDEDLVAPAEGQDIGEPLVRGQRVDGGAGRVRHRQALRDRGELLDRAPAEH
jgi:hypothetical protein